MVAIALAPGCGRKEAAAVPPAEALDAALRADGFVALLRRLGGAHVRATSTFRVSPTTAPAEGVPLGPEAVTTQTELWIDGKGNFRLVETNDQDGGREVILHGRELAVALRYGKLVRRPAQEPEPTRILEEAVGGAWAAWETVRRFADVERTAPGGYRIARSATPASAPAAEATPLRRWRDTVAVQTLEGEARVDEKGGVPVALRLKARFSAQRDGTALDGELAVSSAVDGLGAQPAIAAPVAEDLRLRQRTILEERALLGDLSRREGR